MKFDHRLDPREGYPHYPSAERWRAEKGQVHCRHRFQACNECYWYTFLALNQTRYFLFKLLYHFQLLLNDSKSNANAKGFGAYTPLHIAAQMDSVDICKRLVRNYGIIRNREFSLWRQSDKSSWFSHSTYNSLILSSKPHYERAIKS